MPEIGKNAGKNEHFRPLRQGLVVQSKAFMLHKVVKAYRGAPHKLACI